MRVTKVPNGRDDTGGEPGPETSARSPVLFVMADADMVTMALERRFPAERFLHVADPTALAAALDEHRPEIAFSIKSRELDPAVHPMLCDAPSLKWLQIGGSGYEHILGPDGSRWDETRLSVTNCAGVLAPFLADTCMAAILGINQNLFAYESHRRTRSWRPLSFRPIEGQTLLIVGAGSIGGALALRARAFGMHVVGLRRAYRRQVEGIDEMHPPEALFEQLSRADVVSVHLRLTPQTRGLFNADAFEAMKPGAVFLNTARGGHVVEADLLAALAAGQVGAAYLDVFEEEPLPPASPLWAAENLVLSPHASDQVQDWEVRFADLFAQNLARWRIGEPLLNQVRP